MNFEKKLNIPESAKFNYLGSFLIGIIFAFGWVPCVGMILSGILMMASRLDTLFQGIMLLLSLIHIYTGLKKVRKVISHPHATAQCRSFLNNRLPGAEIIAANSTAEAVKKILDLDDDFAAIGTRVAAEFYDLKICLLYTSRCV